nr:cadherin-like beta sandwich domain-containing protein [uncultured Mucilaginibacter sp.]
MNCICLKLADARRKLISNPAKYFLLLILFFTVASSASLKAQIEKLNQTITFAPVPDNKTFGDAPFAISATTNAGLPVSFTVLSGPATISGDMVTLTGAGVITLQANQPGNSQYDAANVVTQSFTAAKATQTITFNTIPSKPYGTADFAPGAAATSGLAITYTSSNTSVAKITRGKIHIVKAGTSTITASQPGNANFNAAVSTTQLLTVTIINQTIAFATIPPAGFGSPDFYLGAVSSAGLPITYTSSNETVATVDNGQIHIVGLGNTTITASQPGDASVFAATSVTQVLTVLKGNQQINFQPIEQRDTGAGDFSLGAAASSGLPLTFISSNTSVATVTNGVIRIVGQGTTNITASQPGDNNFNAAAPVTQAFTVIPSHDANLVAISSSDSRPIYLIGDYYYPNVFSPQTFNYFQFVSPDVTTVNITAVTSSASATITINGRVAISGAPSSKFRLPIQENNFDIVVTAQDGNKQTYRLTVYRSSVNANLQTLTISDGTLTPAFSPFRTTYKATVSNATTFVTVDATTVHPNAFAYYLERAPLNSVHPEARDLVVGDNTIQVGVTSESGNRKVYTIVFHRQSNTETLAALSISKGTLTPAFSPGLLTYKDTVSNSWVTVKPTAANALATIKVNGVSVATGANSANIPLAVGNNTISTVVTSEDGTKVRTYTIVVHRIYVNTDLANLTLSSGALTPLFSAGTTSYSVTVPNATASISLTPTTSHIAATVKVNGVSVSSGTPSASIPLVNGPNIINVDVTGSDGVALQTYTVTVNRQSNNPKLAGLTISSGDLTPAFAEGTYSYSASVSNATASVMVTPTAANKNATIKVNGAVVATKTASAALPLILGANAIAVAVTSQDGSKTYTYTITVKRLSNNSNLSALSINSGVLTPAFAAGTTNYAVPVSNATATIKITPAAANPHATITVNGTPVVSGTASASLPLFVGSNIISTVVTSEDGLKIRTYTVNITRAAPAGIIALTRSAGSSTPDIVRDSSLSPEMYGVHEPLVKQAVSPNGDGHNDVLFVDGIDNYPDNTLKVINSSGKLIFEIAGYDNVSHIFDGHAGNNGKPQPAGTYFYQLLYKADDGSQKRKTGFFVLKY